MTVTTARPRRLLMIPTCASVFGASAKKLKIDLTRLKYVYLVITRE
jgi:hypothetical protein